MSKMQNDCEIIELRKRADGVRKIRIENAVNTWEIELCEVGIIDMYFKISGFPNYKIYLDGRVESNFKNKTSTRINGECKFNLLNDAGKWETLRLKNLISIVKSNLVSGCEWRK